jgi:predicted glycosyltransferase
VTPRVLFYVQHLLGIGHLKRAAILAEAMAAEGLDVTVAYGGRPFPEVSFEGVNVAYLPPAAIAGEDFSTLLDENDRPVDDAWRAARRDALLKLRRDLDPDVVLIELFPFGRRQFAFEVVPLLEAVHANPRRALVACSVRDVLVASKRPGRDTEIVERIRRFFDAVFVHGDPALIPFGATFSSADQIDDLIRHTGYVTARDEAREPAEGKDEVLVSAGGGAVGADLLFAAAAARASTPVAGNLWRFLTGPNLPASDFEKLTALADTRTIVERFRPDFSARLRNAALSISQAGYNTTMDILAGKRLLTLVPEAELTPARLAAAVANALKTPAATAGVDLSGAATTARLVHELATRRMR